jgi:hypothetical protein
MSVLIKLILKDKLIDKYFFVQKKKAYLPGMQMKEGETLVCDETAYTTLHTFTTAAPCLSFDIIPDGLGHNRVKFPLTSYLISGTQAQRSHANQLIIMKVIVSILYIFPIILKKTVSFFTVDKCLQDATKGK